VLRNAVTDLVVSLNGTTPFGSRLKPLRVIGGAVSGGSGIGRTNVSKDYLESLLTTKIVLLAQRDSWEDHYRLFEAISCGALVMTDPMLSLPDELVDGESIIVNRSLDHLRKLVLYYLDPAHNDERLRIARAGWKLPMGRHRTYHWMEELLFGQRISA
jgi:spore maturation protein CgeB